MGKGAGGRVVAFVYLVVGGLLVIGAQGTWAKVGPFDVGGLDSRGDDWFTDGWIILICALAILLASMLALALPHFGWHILSGIASVAAAWVGLDDWLAMHDTPPQADGLLYVQVGYGLTLTMIVGFAGVGLFALACLNILVSPSHDE